MARIGIVLPSGRITCIPGVYPNGDGSPLAPAPVSGGGGGGSGGGGGGPVLPLQHIDPWIIDAQFTTQSMARVFAAENSIISYPLIYNSGTDTLDHFDAGWGAAAPSHHWTFGYDGVCVTSNSTTLFGAGVGDYNAGDSDIGVYSCPIDGTEWSFLFSVTEFMTAACAAGGDPGYYKINSNANTALMLADGDGDLWLSVCLQHVGETGPFLLDGVQVPAVLRYSGG